MSDSILSILPHNRFTIHAHKPASVADTVSNKSCSLSNYLPFLEFPDSGAESTIRISVTLSSLDFSSSFALT